MGFKTNCWIEKCVSVSMGVNEMKIAKESLTVWIQSFLYDTQEMENYEN